MSNIRAQAEQAASLVDVGEVGLAPEIIAVIIADVVPYAIKCLRRKENLTASGVAGFLEHASGLKINRYHRRTYRLVRARHPELTALQADEITDAIIDHAVGITGPAVYACVMEIDE